jgi:flavodoxin short chain
METQMSTALIVYGSTTGNTEFTAETIEGSLSDSGYDVTTINVSNTDPSVLKDPYDLYLLGSSTWGDDEIEFQEDFAPFFDDMTPEISLEGKKFAIFGCGDSTYEYFCGAVDALEEKVEKMGGKLVVTGLRIDGEPEEDEIKEWAQETIDAA